MKSKVKDSKRLVSKLACDSWSCRACSARKRRQSGRYVAAKLLTTDGVIFESASDPDEWQTQRKRLQRMCASWVRYGPLFRPGVIIGVAPSPFGAPICDREQAIIRLGEVIREMKLVWKDEGSPCRPINYSRDWTPPVREDAYELLEWVRVKNPNSLVDALAELGVCAKAHATSESQWDVSYGIPPEWTEEQAEAVQRVIGAAR